MNDDELAEMLKNIAIISTTMQIILVEKGIVTKEEYAKYAEFSKLKVNELLG